MMPAIVFGVLLDNAEEHWPGRNQLMVALSEYTPVVFLERSRRGRSLNWQRPRIEMIARNQYVVRNAYALRTSRIGRRLFPLTSAVDGWWLRTELKSSGFDNFLFWLTVADPVIAFGIPDERLLYDCMDPNFFPEGQAIFDRNEFALARRARLVFASAESLYRRMKVVNDRTFLLPNACLVPTPGSAGRIESAARDEAIVGYLGTIDWRFDADIVFDAARALSGVTFAIVGRVNLGQERFVEALKSLPNVLMPGQVDQEAGEEWVRQFSVGIIPFHPGQVGDAINPVKMYMYLAHGKPVVSTDIAECRLNPFVAATSTSQDFKVAIEGALVGADEKAAEERREWARQNTWTERARAVLDILRAHRLLECPPLSSGFDSGPCLVEEQQQGRVPDEDDREGFSCTG